MVEEKDDKLRILSLYERGKRKHGKVIIKNPSNEEHIDREISLDELYCQSKDKFYETVCNLKPGIENCCLHGRMKRVFKKDDKNFILNWCKKNIT